MTHHLETAAEYLQLHPNLPDVRYFLKDSTLPLSWDPCRELQYDVDAFTHRMRVFGSSEAKLLVWLTTGEKIPLCSPEDTYMSYPVLMYLLMVANPQLVDWFRNVGPIFDLASGMPPEYRLVASGKCDSIEALEFAKYRDWGSSLRLYRDWGSSIPGISAEKWSCTGEDLRSFLLGCLPPAAAMFAAQPELDGPPPACYHNWEPEQLAEYCCSLPDASILAGSPITNYILWRYSPKEQRQFAQALKGRKEAVDAAILSLTDCGVSYIIPHYVSPHTSQLALLFRYSVTSKACLELFRPICSYFMFDESYSYRFKDLFSEELQLIDAIQSEYFECLGRSQKSQILVYLTERDLKYLFSPEGAAVADALAGHDIMVTFSMFSSFRQMPVRAQLATFLYMILSDGVHNMDGSRVPEVEAKMGICLQHLLIYENEHGIPSRFRTALAVPHVLLGKENPFFSILNELGEKKGLVYRYMLQNDIEGLRKCASLFPIECFSVVDLEMRLSDTQLSQIYGILNSRA